MLRGENLRQLKVRQPPLQTFTWRQDSRSSLIETLTDRELQVFELIGDGFSAKQDSEPVQPQSKTVETHRDKIRAELNLANAAN